MSVSLSKAAYTLLFLWAHIDMSTPLSPHVKVESGVDILILVRLGRELLYRGNVFIISYNTPKNDISLSSASRRTPSI